jgi:hypothetical protein
MAGKLCIKQPIGKKPTNNRLDSNKLTSYQSTETIDDISTILDDMHMPSAEPGQHMHMDFRFIRGYAFDKKDKDGKTVTSQDGKRAYLAIINRSSQYTWVFTTSSKAVPLEPAKMILDKFKSKNKHRTVRVDQGGKLGKSKAFSAMIAEAGFSLELTGSDASAQNLLAENPNRTFGQMMRCILYSEDLGPEYWSWALQHAMYIKNRIPH